MKNLKVILKTRKTSSFSKFNGLTFDVSEFSSDRISISGLNDEFPQNLTDFYLGEFLIVDLQYVVSRNMGGDKWLNRLLVNYCIKEKINPEFQKEGNFVKFVNAGQKI